ncbi:MAG: hypothetical protein SGPRY_010678 [Prymnesium sp.]
MALANLSAWLPSWLDGCYHVYLDVGVDAGLRVRQLYQPKLFPNAPVLPVFAKFLGSAEERQFWACSIGIEPNPRYAPQLHRLQERLTSFGWRTQFLTHAAAWIHSDGVKFYFDKAGLRKFPASRSLAERQSMKRSRAHETWDYERVPTVDLPMLVEYILQRRPPQAPLTQPPRVVMKMDIEGGDYTVLSALHARGLVCRLDYIWLELPYNQSTEPRKLKRAAREPNSRLIDSFHEIFDNIMNREESSPACPVQLVANASSSFLGSSQSWASASPIKAGRNQRIVKLTLLRQRSNTSCVMNKTFGIATRFTMVRSK